VPAVILPIIVTVGSGVVVAPYTVVARRRLQISDTFGTTMILSRQCNDKISFRSEKNQKNGLN
jgi:hypothetical protein